MGMIQRAAANRIATQLSPGAIARQMEILCERLFA
jgi:hypothetical protein